MARLRKTLTDYVVIAISPALIMALVGSLVFFLIQVGYRGGYAGRMEYIFALFVFAAVLIARISIEEGREYSLAFAIPLALAMLLVLGRFTSSSLLFNLVLIGGIWWCADKLTWDCTVIDEGADASGEGLLQTAGLEGSHERSPDDSRAADIEATTSRSPPALSGRLWERFVEHRKRPHAPGVWVIYFSLAALPLFGIGQRFIPAAELGARRYAFQLLCVYTASGLGLLMTTSFLGLRRYLRQRRLEMPVEMASVWLTIGSVMIVALLFACWLLPRPSAEYSITQVPFRSASSGERSASRHGWGREGGQDQNRQTPATAPARDSEQGRPGQLGGPSGSDQAPAEPQPGTAASPDAKPSSNDPHRQDSNRPPDSSSPAPPAESPGDRQESSASPDTKPAEPPPAASSADAPVEAPAQDNPFDEAVDPSEAPAGDSSSGLPGPSELLNRALGLLPHGLKWLYNLIFVAIVAYLVWRNRAQVGAALRNFWQTIRDFWAQLFGRREPEAAVSEAPPAAAAAPRPFADFPDPFVTGDARRWPARELVAYSFQALEAWGREHGCQRAPEQTPHEFAGALTACGIAVGREAIGLADLYCCAAYSSGNLPRDRVGRLRQLWQTLRDPPQPA